jgi:tellurite resistance protein
MTTFLNPVDLELKHVRVIAQSMLRIANSDGQHRRELLLIREFYEACRSEVAGLFDFELLARTPFAANEAKEALSTPDLKLTCLVSALLVAYADGHVSTAEGKALAELTIDIGATPELMEEARELVKDQLLLQLARSDNLEVLREIASKL